MTGKRSRTLAKLAGLLVTSMAAVAAAPLAAQAADAVLSGTITSASGEKMAGVTVSAKPEGSTITTSVYTDEQGNYYFPPMPAGKYQVWAQALTFERSKGAVDLAAARRADLVLKPITDPERRIRQMPGEILMAALPEDDARRRQHQAHLPQPLHRLPHVELCAAVPLRRGRLEQDHRPDEGRAEQRRLSGQSEGQRA